MELKTILAKRDGIVFGKTVDGNVIFNGKSGEVISTGWFESLEDGWYLDINNKQEFFGGSADDVVSYFAQSLLTTTVVGV